LLLIGYGLFVPALLLLLQLSGGVLRHFAAELARQPVRNLSAVFGDLLGLLLDRRADLLQVLIDAPPVYLGDDVTGEVEHLLQRSRGDVQYERQRARNALEVPDVAHGRS